MDSNKKTARVAGLLYLLLAITAAFGIMYAPSQLFVKGDAVKTATNVLANPMLYGLGTLAHLISQILFIYLGLYLYRLFRNVDEFQAKAMFALIMVQVPVVFVIEIFYISALWVLKGELLPSFSLLQQQEIAYMFMRIHSYGIMMLGIYYGLWLIPLGILFWKADFMPKIIGGMLILGGITYLYDSFAFILAPNYRIEAMMMIVTIAEISTVFWLLIKGILEPKTN
jgi:hypothetical protein